MTPLISVDADSAVPPFEQIRQQLADLIESGALAGGERLPTVRQLAGDLRVANGTVARAYRELESAGLVVTRRAAGTRVAPRRAPSSSGRRAILGSIVQGAVSQARTLGFTESEILAAVRTALDAAPSASRSTDLGADHDRPLHG